MGCLVTMRHKQIRLKMSDGSFLLSISGQIEWVDILASAGSAWHVKYEFVTGADWKIVGGLEMALSQTANVVRNGTKIVLNFPVDIIYKSSNPYGWPQIVLSVYNGFQLQGYGRCHVPIQAGTHNVRVSLSKPQPSSLFGYVGSFFGYQPELLQPKMLATDSGTGLIRMMSHGEVNCSLNVITQNLLSLGYDIGNKYS